MAALAEGTSPLEALGTPTEGRLHQVARRPARGARRGRGRGRLLDRPLVRRPDRRGRRGGVRAARAARCTPSAPRELRSAKRLGLSDAARRVAHRGDRGRGPPRIATRSASSPSSRRWTPAAASSRRARRTTSPPTRTSPRSSPPTRPRVVILGAGPEPDRPGHRVRLRLRARRVRAGGGRASSR